MHSRLLAPVRGWEARRALRAARARADRELVEARLPSPRLAWRSAELVADEHRIGLARDLTDVLRASDERLLPGSTPIDRAAVRACRAQLLALAGRVCDLDRPVAPRGVLLVEALFGDGSGPIYGDGDGARLAREIAAASEALERGNGPAR
jgi:hypothetical protein